MDSWTKLPSSRFTFDKYSCRNGYSYPDLFGSMFHGDDFSLADGVEPVGYCDATDLPVRPRRTGYAVMVQVDGEDTWAHVDSLPNISKSQTPLQENV